MVNALFLNPSLSILHCNCHKQDTILDGPLIWPSTRLVTFLAKWVLAISIAKGLVICHMNVRWKSQPSPSCAHILNPIILLPGCPTQGFSLSLLFHCTCLSTAIISGSLSELYLTQFNNSNSGNLYWILSEESCQLLWKLNSCDLRQYLLSVLSFAALAKNNYTGFTIKLMSTLYLTSIPIYMVKFLYTVKCWYWYGLA